MGMGMPSLMAPPMSVQQQAQGMDERMRDMGMMPPLMEMPSLTMPSLTLPSPQVGWDLHTLLDVDGDDVDPWCSARV